MESIQIVMAIHQGHFDNGLESIFQAIQSRREMIGLRAAAELESGDQFHLTNISPKYLDGAVVQFDRLEGDTLICTMIWGRGRKYPTGSEVRLRKTHVGEIV